MKHIKLDESRLLYLSILVLCLLIIHNLGGSASKNST